MEENALTGTNKLARRILSDARADAEKTLQDAEISAASVLNECEARIAALVKEYEARRAVAVHDTLDGCRTRATIDGKKAALAQKRKKIETAFSACYDAMLRLDGDARTAILSRILSQETDGGETVVPAKPDRAALEKLIAACPEKKLTLSASDADVDAGFIVQGAGYEKNCSFASILNEVRSEEETNVAKLLFSTLEE